VGNINVADREEAREGLVRGANNKKNICETLRMINDEVYGMPDTERITELILDAFIMGKKMQNRLSYYQKKYKDNTGNKAKDIEGLEGVNERARMRKARTL